MSDETRRQTFLEALREQRFDDHRYYHHSRVNQSLHLVSASCFLATYVLLAIDPIPAALLGWLGAMVIRQVGHFFFEPKGYDEVNDATHEHKESIKVGYNLRRKVVLLSLWAATPLLLWASPSFFGLFEPCADGPAFLHHLSVIWLGLAAIGLVFRTLYLCFTRGPQTGIVWFTKILTDPFHDILLYYKAPYYLFKGQWIDPMSHARTRP
jgi:hypothetical protein